MSLSQRVVDLSAGIRDYIKQKILPRLLPAGGSAGQVLAKSAGANYSVTWVTPTGGGATNLVIGTVQPTPATGQQVFWVQDLGNGNWTFNVVTGD